MTSALRSGAIAALLTVSTLAAQSPRLLRDICAVPPAVSSDPGPFVASGPLVWFAAEHDAVGRELFAVDAAGSVLVRAEDVRPGPDSSDPDLVTPFAGGVLFVARIGAHHELRFAHPAAPGTVALWSGPRIYAVEVAAGPLAFFTVITAARAGELWCTDGTSAGTRLLHTFASGIGVELASLGGAVFFAAGDSSTGSELWRSDGTAAGTALFADLMPGAPHSLPHDLVSGGGVLWFVATTSVGPGIWRSDGTVAGTALVYAGLVDELTAVGSDVFFVENAWNLWFSDGTAPGTRQVASLFVRTGRQFASDGSRLFFTDAGLSVSDGTVAGTRALASGSPAHRGLATSAGRAFVVLDDDLWVSDGTAAGTQVVRTDVDRGQSMRLSQGMALAVAPSGRAFFVGQDAAGDEPWTSDGTAAGTQRVLDLRPPRPGATVSSQPGSPWFVAGPGAGSVLMPRDDGVHGVELWRTDGTVAGTVLVSDLTPGPEGSRITGLLVHGDEAWFTPYPTPLLQSGLWRTDGSAAGTRAVLLAPALGAAEIAIAGPMLRGGRFLLWVDDRLFASDGTVAGSILLGIPSGASASPHYFGGDAGVAFFSTIRGEVWRTDGSAAATSLVVPSTPNGTQAAAYLGAFRGGSVLRVYTSVPSPTGPMEATQLRVVDMPASVPVTFSGVANGAVLDDRILIFAGNDLLVWDGIAQPARIATFTSAGSPAVRLPNAEFFMADDGVHGTEPWWTDGTAAGTHMIADLHPGPTSTDVTYAQQLRDRVVFWADMPGVGREPWGTDGTAAGTAMIGDLEPGAGSSEPGFNGVFVGARRVSIAVRTSAAGIEPWLTDGTASGSRFVGDLLPGPESSMDRYGPFGAVLPGALVFDADDGLRGSEPWLFPVEGVATSLDTSPCADVPLFVVNDPVLGQSWEMRVPWMPANTVGLTLIGPPAARPVALGAGCHLHVDPAGLAVLTPIVPNAQGAWSYSFPLPNVPALAGIHVVVQPVFAPSTSPLGVDPGLAWSAVLGR